MKEKAFWDWFREHKTELEKFIASNTDDYSLFNELTSKLRSYNDLVMAELTKDLEKNNILVLTCDGRRDGITAVESLYENAPQIDKWKIQKFRAPGHVKELNYQGLALKPDAIKVKYTWDGNYYNIEMFIRGYSESDERYKGLAFLYLDHLVGEYHVMTKIGQIEFKKLGLFTGTSDKVSLQELRIAIERLN